MKKQISVLAACLLTAGALAGCGGSPQQEQPSSSGEAKSSSQDGEAKEPVTLRLMQYKPEITQQVHALAEEYHRQFPHVTIEVEILQQDYKPVLKSKINAGAMPDIFMTSGYMDNLIYQEYSYDFKDDPILDRFIDSALIPATQDGSVYGLPMLVEGYGIIYNKKIFEECGITELPETLEELEAAAETIQEHGITPFANGFKEAWIPSHLMTKYYAAEYYENYADSMSAYAFAQKIPEELSFTGLPIVQETFDCLDLMVKYGNERPVETDVSQQISLFAEGKAAMISNVSGNEASILMIEPDMELGFLPVPGSDPGQAKLMVDANTMYCLNKDSENFEEAYAFLEWLFTSEYGEDFIVEQCGFIPTVKDWAVPEAMLAQEISSYMNEGRVYACAHGFYPDGYFDQSGAVLQTYVVGTNDRSAAQQELDQVWRKLAKSQE